MPAPRPVRPIRPQGPVKEMPNFQSEGEALAYLRALDKQKARLDAATQDSSAPKRDRAN